MPSSPDIAVTDSTFDLWHRLRRLFASETDAALTHLQEWIDVEIGTDNVI